MNKLPFFVTLDQDKSARRDAIANLIDRIQISNIIFIRLKKKPKSTPGGKDE